MAGRGKDGAERCKGCGIGFKHDEQGPDVHDNCWDLWEWKCMFAVETAAREVVKILLITNDLALALEALDNCRRRKLGVL